MRQEVGRAVREVSPPPSMLLSGLCGGEGAGGVLGVLLYFLSALGFELWDSCLLSRYCTALTRASPFLC
jgi:hypothetical protein